MNIDEDIAYSIGWTVAQHFDAKSVVIGFDAREKNPGFVAPASKGVRDACADVLNISMVGIEKMYRALTEFSAYVGIEVAASHNPIDYNGTKIMKSHSRPLDDMSDL